MSRTVIVVNLLALILISKKNANTVNMTVAHTSPKVVNVPLMQSFLISFSSLLFLTSTIFFWFVCLISDENICCIVFDFLFFDFFVFFSCSAPSASCVARFVNFSICSFVE